MLPIANTLVAKRLDAMRHTEKSMAISMNTTDTFLFIFLVFLSGFLEYTIYFIGTLSQTLTLRAAFASSTYLLPQIHGPGRSSDDDLLIPLRLSEKSSRD